MVDNMLSELKKIEAPVAIADMMREHREAIESCQAACFNVDNDFRFVLNTTLDLNGCLNDVTKAVKKAQTCFDGVEPSQVLTELMAYCGKDASRNEPTGWGHGPVPCTRTPCAWRSAATCSAVSAATRGCSR